MNDNAKHYLGYLDKEMNIMGVLSAFCVTVPALVLERLASSDKGNLLNWWLSGKHYFWMASGLMFVAAAFFYKERSLLAFHYNGIAKSMSSVSEFPQQDEATLNKLLQDADSWTTWIPYNLGFWTGVGAVLSYFFGFISTNYPSIWYPIPCWLYVILVFWVVMIITTVKVYGDRPINWDGNAWKDCYNRKFRKMIK